VLRGEVRYGTALVTDVIPKTLEDYEQTSLESLTADSANLTVPHEALVSLVMRKEEPKFRLRDFFVWLAMRRQGEIFQVYDFLRRITGLARTVRPESDSTWYHWARISSPGDKPRAGRQSSANTRWMRSGFFKGSSPTESHHRSAQDGQCMAASHSILLSLLGVLHPHVGL